MNFNEQALKTVLKKNVLYNCIMSPHAQEQIEKYVYEGFPLDYFDSETKKELSNYYKIIKNAYYLETKEYIPNIFMELEG